MNLTRDRMRNFGWAFVLTVCLAITMAVTLRVNALKSEVRLAERQIVSLKREALRLETEFETRSSQQELASLNEVEFGLSAPTAGQYLEGERQLAALGKPRSADAPEPIRVAVAAGEGPQSETTFPEMVSPLTGKAMAAEVPAAQSSMPEAGNGTTSARIKLAGAQRE